MSNLPSNAATKNDSIRYNEIVRDLGLEEDPDYLNLITEIGECEANVNKLNTGLQNINKDISGMFILLLVLALR